MGGRSAYVGWFGRAHLPEAPDTDEKIDFKLEDFAFENNILNFKIVRYTSRYVPVRYTTINYQRHPVEWKESVRSAIVFKYHKYINVERFCEVELKNLNIDLVFKDMIMKKLDFIPGWRKKELDLANKNKNLKDLQKKLISSVNLDEELDPIKNKYKQQIYTIETKRDSIKTKPTTKKSKIIRSIFSPFTLGLSWVGFVSKNRAKKNKCKVQELNENIKKTEQNREEAIKNKTADVKKRNKIIKEKNQATQKSINAVEKQIKEINEKDYSLDLGEDGFINLRKKLPSITKFNTKGVYVIWNKTKNRYYVGQSKDVYKRLFTQHFNNNGVKNIIFARDWFNEDEFFYKIFPLETKDELDNKEKELIEKYDSFRNGYNGTGGNY